jgi:hypothetical protein
MTGAWVFALFLHGDPWPMLEAAAIFIPGLIICVVIAYRLNKSWKRRPK